MEVNRPGALKVLAIVVIVLGSLVALNAFWQTITLAFQEPLQQMNMMFMDQPGVPEETVARQRQMLEDSFEVQRDWRPFLWAVTPISFVFGIVLILGGAWCVRINPAGRRVLTYACAFGILFAIVREVGAILMQLQMSQAMREHMSTMVSTGDEQAAAFMSSMMGATMALTVAFGGGWLLIKLAIYVWGLVYLTRESIRAVFEGPIDSQRLRPQA